MKRFLIALALTCVFSVSTLAGEVPMTSPAPPPPTQTQGIAATVVLVLVSLVRR